jgi:hypothetical protein
MGDNLGTANPEHDPFLATAPPGVWILMLSWRVLYVVQEIESSTARGRMFEGMMKCFRVAVPVASSLILATLVTSQAAWGQTSQIRGRVLDRERGSAVSDATILFTGQDTAFLAISDSRGLFSFSGVKGGTYEVRVRHLSYGEHREGVEVEADAVVALRILISQQAIRLDPLVVEAMSQRELQARSRGTMIQEVTREEIERAARTSYHFGDILRQTVPGLQVRDTPSQPGARLCVEFRGRRSIRFARSCQTPVLILDGVRMHDPSSLYSTIQPSSIQRIEVIPPAEAGLLYGSESANGVLVVETKVWLEEEEKEALPGHLRSGTYDWSLEVAEHSWKKVLLASLVGNAIGVVAGVRIADQCVRFDELDRDLFATDCGGWGTAGAYTAALTLPLLGAALGARYAGATPLSRGSLVPAMVSGLVALLPGYAMVSVSQESSSSSSFRAGQVMVFLGIPLAVTVADRMFRKFRGR